MRWKCPLLLVAMTVTGCCTTTAQPKRYGTSKRVSPFMVSEILGKDLLTLCIQNGALYTGATTSDSK
uniref:Putative secreted protein n=1 Tax=Anopheles marajoara TaxID=58244 RepID=A0A2M4CGT7_9DIPT